jgi:SNF2 family DNA or RNA helicase
VKQYDHGLNAILADEMGLGKTLMTISFLVRRRPAPHAPAMQML